MYRNILATLLLVFVSSGLFAQNKAPNNQNPKECPILMPNAFTPNYDGVNDFFFFTFNEECLPTSFTLNIFDRWGRLVFETNDYQAKWDGQFDGQDLKDDAYYWVMSSSIVLPMDETPTVFSKKGSVLIVR